MMKNQIIHTRTTGRIIIKNCLDQQKEKNTIILFPKSTIVVHCIPGRY